MYFWTKISLPVCNIQREHYLLTIVNRDKHFLYKFEKHVCNSWPWHLFVVVLAEFCLVFIECFLRHTIVARSPQDVSMVPCVAEYPITSTRVPPQNAFIPNYPDRKCHVIYTTLHKKENTIEWLRAVCVCVCVFCRK